MSDNNVTLPAELFIALQEEAAEAPSTTERVASTIQTTAVLAAMAGTVTAGFYGYFKLADWYDQRKFDRKLRAVQKTVNPETK